MTPKGNLEYAFHCNPVEVKRGPVVEAGELTLSLFSIALLYIALVLFSYLLFYPTHRKTPSFRSGYKVLARWFSLALIAAQYTV